MHDVYRTFAEEAMAMPVLSGKKTDAERFAGAVDTYTIEAMMQDNKALQAGTSHYLGTNFAVAFGTQYQDENGKMEHVHQTSWGVSTRLVGALILTHSDDQGLVIPPRVAPTQVVLIPIFKKKVDPSALREAMDKLAAELRPVCSVKMDDRQEYSPGWKFHEYEMLGVPVRIEVGPRDLEAGTALIARRDTREKMTVPIGEVAAKIPALLDEIQTSLLAKARERLAANTHEIDDYDRFRSMIDDPGGFFEAHWCGDAGCETKIKEDTKATIRRMPFEWSGDEGTCLLCGKPSPGRVTLAKAY